MASLGEVGAQLHVVLDHAEKIVGLLRDVENDVAEAADSLMAVGFGSSQSAQFDQAAAQWRGAAELAGQLLQRLAAVRELLTAYLDQHLARQTAWADQERAKLPTYITSGRSVDEDGHTGQSCDRLVQYILRPGQVLVVHDPHKRRVFKGRDL
jgi:hypothetical protein